MSGRLLPGEGELPLVALTQHVLADHPAAVVGVEVFSGELQAMPAIDAALLAGTAIRDVLLKV
jgi:hypothetical protein